MDVVIDRTHADHLTRSTSDELTSWLISNLKSIADSHIQSAYLSTDEWTSAASLDCQGFLLEIHRQTKSLDATNQWVARFIRNDQSLLIHCHIEGAPMRPSGVGSGE